MTLEKASSFSISTEELQAIDSDDGMAFLNFLLKLDAQINSSKDEQVLLRKINFLAYELKAIAEGMSEEDKVHALNHFFFEKHSYCIENLPTFQNLSLQKLLVTKSADGLLLVILYKFFASQMNLPIYPISIQPMHVLKWYRFEKSLYIDLSRNGKIFSLKEIIPLLNENQNNKNCLEALTTKQLFFHYLEILCRSLELESKNVQLMICLDLILEMDQKNLKALCQRGMLHHKNGHFHQATKDLKKYFAFTDLATASKELKKIYHYLLDWNKAENQPVNSEMLH